jgi:elongation factor G
MGTLHLEIKRHRIERDFKLKVRIGKPRVSYRETIKSPVTIEADASHLAGAANLVARATVKFEPWTGPEPVRVLNRLAPDALPEAFQNALEQGIRSGLDSGEVGFPVINVQATILSATMQEGLSTDSAFAATGADAARQALRDNSLLLEPVMSLEVTVPDDYLGAITGDLQARRAEITGQTQRGKLCVVEAVVALARMFDYADKVRSLSAGRASYTMEPLEYRPAPDEVLRKMLDPFGA